MTKVNRKSSAVRREEIADAVLHIIGEQGLTSLTTATVARAIGVSSGALFRHFDSRDGMLVAAVRLALREVDGTFPSSALSPLDRLTALAAARVGLMSGRPGIAWLLKSDQAFLELPPDAVSQVQAMMLRTRAFVLAALHEGAAAGSIRRDIAPEVLLVTYVGTIHALVGPVAKRQTNLPTVAPASNRVLAGLRLLFAVVQGAPDSTVESIDIPQKGKMMNMTSETPVGKIAAAHPLVTRVFARHQMDFCCGGGRTLGVVCEEKGLAVADILQEMQAELATSADSICWDDAPLDDLVAHILVTFHEPLKEELPRLVGMAAKVLEVHGDKDRARFTELANLVSHVSEDLLNHLSMEEDILFPMIQQESGYMAQGPIEVMEVEHEAVGDCLRRLRELTNGYEAPPEACNTWRALWHGLGALESDLHEHIHLENNILFPRVLESE